MSQGLLRRFTDRGHRRDVAKVRHLVDSEYYLARYPDIRDHQMDPAEHYCRHGWTEGRDPSARFSTLIYQLAFPETAGTNPLVHFADHQPMLVDMPFGDAMDRGMREASDIEVYFDEAGYRAQCNLDPRIPAPLHYAMLGWREGYDPNPLFVTKNYLQDHPDVAAAGVNPFWHFIMAGRREGRELKTLEGTIVPQSAFEEPEAMSSALLRQCFDLKPFERVDEEELAALRAELGDVLPYGIICTARSGSTFLTHELGRRKVFSLPDEWFNWDSKPAHYQEGRGFLEYLRHTVRTHRSETGAFGFEINWLQLGAMNGVCELQAVFPHRIVWFFLRRRDIVAQAVSLVIAAQTEIYHSYQLKTVDPASRPAPSYDPARISNVIREIIRQERMVDRWCASKSITPIPLYYEDITSDPERTVAIFANALRIWDTSSRPGRNPISKLGSQINEEFRDRFRLDNRQMLAELEVQRPGIWVGSRGLPGNG